MMISQEISQANWRIELQNFLDSKPKKPLLVVLGPTASGKTDFSISLAKTLSKDFQKSVEILNADSRQLYKFLDIGTAKITKEEMRGVPHHLLDVLDPKEECTIAWYQKEATKIIDDVHVRGGVPMLVGGSMLYLSAMIDGLKPIDSDPVIRARLSSEYDRDAGVTLHKRLIAVDPESAALIPRENKVYVLRALEIFETTGIPKSKQRRTSNCPYDLLIFGIEIDRAVLRKRIQQRTEKMLASGWIDEVRSLLARGYTANDPAMKSHGYLEIVEFLEGQEGKKAGGQEVDLAEKISSHVRKYAKRQRTWWKGDERIRWIKI